MYIFAWLLYIFSPPICHILNKLGLWRELHRLSHIVPRAESQMTVCRYINKQHSFFPCLFIRIFSPFSLHPCIICSIRFTLHQNDSTPQYTVNTATNSWYIYTLSQSRTHTNVLTLNSKLLFGYKRHKIFFLLGMFFFLHKNTLTHRLRSFVWAIAIGLFTFYVFFFSLFTWLGFSMAFTKKKKNTIFFGWLTAAISIMARM